MFEQERGLGSPKEHNSKWFAWVVHLSTCHCKSVFLQVGDHASTCRWPMQAGGRVGHHHRCMLPTPHPTVHTLRCLHPTLAKARRLLRCEQLFRSAQDVRALFGELERRWTVLNIPAFVRCILRAGLTEVRLQEESAALSSMLWKLCESVLGANFNQCLWTAREGALSSSI